MRKKHRRQMFVRPNKWADWVTRNKGPKRHKKRMLTSAKKEEIHYGSFNTPAYTGEWIKPKPTNNHKYDWKSLKNSVLKHHQYDASFEVAGTTGKQGVAIANVLSAFHFRRALEQYAETDQWTTGEATNPIYFKRCFSNFFLQHGCTVPIKVNIYHFRCTDTHALSVGFNDILKGWSDDLNVENDMARQADDPPSFVAPPGSNPSGTAFTVIPSIYTRNMHPHSEGAIGRHWKLLRQKTLVMNPGDMRKITIYHGKHKKIMDMLQQDDLAKSSDAATAKLIMMKGFSDAVIITTQSLVLGTTASSESLGANNENWTASNVVCKVETHMATQVIPYTNVHLARRGYKIVSAGCPTSNVDYVQGAPGVSDPFFGSLKAMINENTNTESLKFT